MEFNLSGYIENSKDSDSDLDRLKMQPVNGTHLNTVSNKPNQAYLTDIDIYNKIIIVL